MSAATGTDPRAALLAVMFDTVAEAGLDRLSVREVAARAGVSIGAVQHHFRTKDDMLSAAFEELVGRTRARIDRVRWGTDVRTNVVAALSQLLPLDDERAAEARVHLAFAARAAVTPDLAAVQALTLRRVTTELSAAVGSAPSTAERSAMLLLAGVDGLALHAVSTGARPAPRRLRAALDSLVDAVLG